MTLEGLTMSGSNGNGGGHKEPKKYTDSRSIDDVVGLILKNPAHDIEKNFEYLEEYNERENKNHIFNNIVAPAVDEFYDTLKKELDAAFKGDDKALIKNKKQELQGVILKALKAFYNKAMPAALVPIKKMSDEEAHDYLTGLFDRDVLGVRPGDQPPEGLNLLSNYAASVAKRGKTTVGHIKRSLYDQKHKQIAAIMGTLDQRAASHYIGNVPQHQLSQYVLGKLEEDHKLDNPESLHMMDKGALVQLHDYAEDNPTSNLPPSQIEALGIYKKKAAHGNKQHAHAAAGAGH